VEDAGDAVNQRTKASHASSSARVHGTESGFSRTRARMGKA
jgi:hypothetical protein